MSNIDRHNGKNYGGITALRYAIQKEVAHVIGYNEVVAVKGTFSLSQADYDSLFYTVVFQDRTGNYDHNKKSSEYGALYEHALEVQLPKFSADVMTSRLVSTDRQLLAIATLTNGDLLLIPGLYTDHTFNSGKEPKDLNGITLRLVSGHVLQPLRLTITA